MIHFEKILPQHWEAVKNIYLEGIATGFATFQDDAPTWESWDASHVNNCRIILMVENAVAGWAALSPVSSRCVYGGVAEVSIYMGQAYRGKGLGKQLLQQLILESETAGFWTLQSGIFPENVGSIQLHLSCGFRQIGFREKIGQKNGVWKDNVLMERRSKIVGA